MEIKIKADDMFEILVEQGVDEIHAKAIIFDLLYVAEGSSNSERSIPRTSSASARSHPRVRPPAREFREEQQNSEEALENIQQFEEDEEEHQTRKTLGNSKRVSGKRLDFSKFGGPAQSPTYMGNK